MLNVLARRNKTVRVTLIPTNVQGESAAPQIVEAMKTAFKLPDVDVIIIGRGGGSMEDLWAFNDEKLARLIAASPVPVISAVGHEIDFTIADFVADLRAPTPSAAAELVVKSSEELSQKLKLLDRLLSASLQKQIRTHLHNLKALSARLVDPKRKLQDLIQRADDLQVRLGQSILRYFDKRRLSLQLLVQKIPQPLQIISKNHNRVDLSANQLQSQFLRRFDFFRSKTNKAMALLDGLSPLRVVERGYSLTLKENKVVKDIAQLKKNDKIEIYLMRGQVHAQVISTEEKESPWILKKN
jgi:exodeoxyribonuclease VII large subunit